MVRAYWWNDLPNFGDQLTPPLLRHYAGHEAIWSPIAEAEVISVGSILEHVQAGWNGAVLGAGRLLEDSPLNLDDASVYAVRGPLSARGLKGDLALGDPGLLADEMVDVYTRDIELGIVPHWSDTDLLHDHRFQPYDPVIISPWKDPKWVVTMIGRCKKIVASSLHGIILADAFGIPRRTEPAKRFKDDPREGQMFKFRDYNESVGVPFRTGETQRAKRGMIDLRKSELFDAFKGFQ